MGDSRKDPLSVYASWNRLDVNENANRYQGPSGFFAWLLDKYMEDDALQLMPGHILKAHLEGVIYVHKLPHSVYIPYCTGHSIARLLKKGLRTITIVSRPARHFDTFVDHIANFLITMQHYFTGAQALSSVEWYAGPFIKTDKPTYKQVKQQVQRLLYNLNYPTRIGLQCLSQDTRILTPEGWKSYKDLKEGDNIYTFNMKTKKIEIKPVKQVAIYNHKGKMFNLRGRNQNQLISPGHRVVWLSFNNHEIVRFNPIEDLLQYKSPIPIPTTAYAENPNEEYPVSDDVIKLVAWFLSEGSVDRTRRGDKEYKRVVFHHPDIAQPDCNDELVELLKKMGFEYRASQGYSKRIKLSAKSSRKFFKIVGVLEKKPPHWLCRLSRRQARLFIETYIKGNRWVKYEEGVASRRRITTTDPDIKDALVAVAVLAGFNVSVKCRKFKAPLKKVQYVISLTETKNEYVKKISEVEYEGVIWSVNTDNETVIAERSGCVFITGNTPFTNFTVTMDASKKMLEGDKVVYGGVEAEPLGVYEEEAKVFLKALTELYYEGDSVGQPFTFPIPTLMVTAKWLWEDPEIHEVVFKTAAKRGSFYWLNTRMVDPDATFAMCCRLSIRMDELQHAYRNTKFTLPLKKDLEEARESYWRTVERQKFGGLWAMPDITGSINVVDVNLPRLALEAKKDESRFWELYDETLKLIREACNWFRNRYVYIMKNYPNFYAMIVEYMPEFPGTHFNTVGLIGLPEAAAIVMGEPKLWLDGSRKDWLRAAELMRRIVEYATDRARKWMLEEGIPWNVEEVPGESASPKLAMLDLKRYPELAEYLPDPENPVYATSIAPYYADTMELPDRVEVEQRVQKYFTGGVMMHIFLGEEAEPEALTSLTKKLVQTELVYWSYTPAITHCNNCNKTYTGIYQACPSCGSSNVDIWSRIIGYYRPLRNWNPQRRREFWTRKHHLSLTL